MKFTRKLITPVLATVLLIGGAAFAQDTFEEVVSSDGTWQDAGLFQWRYDAETGILEWGDVDCDSATEVVQADPAADAEELATAETPGCREVNLTEPRKPVAGDDEEPEEPELGSDTEVNQGDLVSRFAHDVKEADEAGELPDDANRGSIISQIARGAQDLFDHDDDADDSETEIEEVEEEDEDESGEESERPDKPDKEPPAKAKGKNK